jgi:hypothetical protein
MGHAKRRIEFWTDAERAAHDAALAADLKREFPRPPSRDRCAEAARKIDLDRKNVIRVN